MVENSARFMLQESSALKALTRLRMDLISGVWFNASPIIVYIASIDRMPSFQVRRDKIHTSGKNSFGKTSSSIACESRTSCI